MALVVGFPFFPSLTSNLQTLVSKTLFSLFYSEVKIAAKRLKLACTYVQG